MSGIPTPGHFLKTDGFHEQALAAARNALNIHLSDGSDYGTDYYRNQLKKIQNDFISLQKSYEKEILR